ncbi:MAG: ribonuclease III [Bryobacterales bacterium]|nr:ribonuclease III [Bryobacteraceae bacterium]MDW8353724.1 ribonuclease III [Bryobacterales bacterium]
MPEDLESLEAALGYCFRDKQLLRQALTHRSRVYETGGQHNERLEFLGDAVLGFLVSEALVQAHPELSEGRLSRLRARLVSSWHLYEAAVRLELGKYLLLGRGEEHTGGRHKKALLANALEALIAALYLDGGMEAARHFVSTHIARALKEIEPAADYKGALQELAQARKLPAPQYVTVAERGPAHARMFTVEARIGREWSAVGEAPSKKDASQQAARRLLERLRALE